MLEKCFLYEFANVDLCRNAKAARRLRIACTELGREFFCTVCRTRPRTAHDTHYCRKAVNKLYAGERLKRTLADSKCFFLPVVVEGSELPLFFLTTAQCTRTQKTISAGLCALGRRLSASGFHLEAHFVLELFQFHFLFLDQKKNLGAFI